MEISDVLKESGLSEKQSQVYLALLELGTATVNPVATKAGIKRPTTYLILDELQAKGLVSTVPRAKKALYTAESPEKIVSDLSKKQELMKRFMPNMLALYNAKIDKPQVLLFEGVDAVRATYDKILKAKEVAWFSTIKDVLSMYPEFPKKLNQHAMTGAIKVRELLTRSQADFDYVKTLQHGEHFQQRFVQGTEGFLTDNGLYDGKVVFFYFQPYISAIQISSQAIYQSMKNLYEFAWNAAEPYENVVK